MSDKAVAKIEPRSSAQATELVQMLEKVAMDPNLPVEKLERLLDLQERVLNRQAETDFNASMTAAQMEMGPISADATNPQTRSKYASYPKLDKRLRPIYTRHGFALSFDEGDSPKEEHIRVLCYVSHRGGHSKTYHKDMPADGKGAKGGDVMTKTHAAGAAMTYGMRYLLKGIFNVAVGEEDKDGNTGETITEKQVAELEALITETGADKVKFLRWGKVKSLSEINVTAYNDCVKMLERKRKQATREPGEDG